MRLEIVNNEIEITKEEEVLPYEVSENIRYKNSISLVDIFSRGVCEITRYSLFLFGRDDINVFRGMEIGEKITIQNNKNIDLNTPNWREAIDWFNNKYGVKKQMLYLRDDKAEFKIVDHPAGNPTTLPIKTCEQYDYSGVTIEINYGEIPSVKVHGKYYHSEKEIAEAITRTNRNACALSFAREKLKEIMEEK